MGRKKQNDSASDDLVVIETNTVGAPQRIKKGIEYSSEDDCCVVSETPNDIQIETNKTENASKKAKRTPTKASARKTVSINEALESNTNSTLFEITSSNLSATGTPNECAQASPNKTSLISNTIPPISSTVASANTVASIKNIMPPLSNITQSATIPIPIEPSRGRGKKSPRTKKSIQLPSINPGTSLPSVENSKPDLTPSVTNEPNQADQIEAAATEESKRLENSKYIVKFKSGSFEKDFYLNDSDPVEIIYKELFGNDMNKKIIYEDEKLSRLLLAGESGFFPGVNYVYLPENETFSQPSKKTITLKFGENEESDLKIEINQDYKADDLIKLISEREDAKDRTIMLLFNGKMLENNAPLDLILEDGTVIDVIDSFIFK